ncbi:unnamed protein product [Penicillium egyptiacum]|uniref:Uncharacterized protein n=1 Tax=Penicillium egyptiacum TaxID=1303716 RepID=A0A9W4K895_9EURO|nr:unnamed protein product [Penicillium egyptiacum]
MPEKAKVAVIGLGASDLATLKNLAEGFDITGFERSSSIGGVWSYDVSTTKTTALANDTPIYPPARQVHQYLQDYALYFKLNDLIETNTEVVKMIRNNKADCWELTLRSNATDSAEIFMRQFDRVVIATGINQLPVSPKIKGIERFRGTVIHSQQYKGPSDFTGKRVLVVGSNNFAGDTATNLLGVAEKICSSHRKGTIFLKRWNKNKPVDHNISWTRLQIMQNYMDYIPKIYNWSIIRLQNQYHTLRPEWQVNENLRPFTQCLPLINDEIVGAMQEEKIIPVANLTETRRQFSILRDYQDEFQNTYDTPITLPGSRADSKPVPKLYQNIFSLNYPDSLAYVCGVGFQMAVFHVYDLASTALAQVRKGNITLPPRDMMQVQVDSHYQWFSSQWYVWVNETAGTNVHSKLGYGMQGWRFRLRDRSFCNTLMYGMLSPHLYRLFDGPRRKKWDGARTEILRVVKEINEM